MNLINSFFFVSSLVIIVFALTQVPPVSRYFKLTKDLENSYNSNNKVK